MLKNAAGAPLVRASWAAVVCNVVIFAWPAAAFAAEQAPADADEDEELTEVQVTGTRIQSPNVTSANPITSITAEEMRRLGIVNVGDALTTLVPQNLSTYTPFAVSDTRVDFGNQDGANRGMNFIGNTIANLRGLDPAYGTRTLTMIDGKRVVSTSNQADVVDLNIIPSNLLERMDVVTGGASATYGSGAMAGVVNLVLNRRMTGINLDMDYAINEAGDGGSPHVSFSAGQPLFGGKGHVLLGLEWEDTAAIRNCAAARDWCAESRTLFSNGSGTTAGVSSSLLSNQLPGFEDAPGRFQMANVRYSQFSPNGVILINGQTFATSAYRFTADGTGIEEYALGYRAGANAGFGPANSVMNGDGPVVTSGTSLTAGRERKSAFSNFEYDFTSSTTGYLQARYATTEGDNRNTYVTSTNCVRFDGAGVTAIPGANVSLGSVVNAGSTTAGFTSNLDPALANANFRAYLGIPASAGVPGGFNFVAPYWINVGSVAANPVPAPPNFVFYKNGVVGGPVAAVGTWTPAQNLGGNWWYQLIRVTITDAAGFTDPNTPARLPTLGRNAYAFLNNLTPQALEAVQRGAFTPSNNGAVPDGAFTSSSTGPVVAYLTGQNPCSGYTPIKKVWSPQFNQSTTQKSDTMNFQIGARGRFGSDWRWETYYQYGQTKSDSFQNNAATTIRQMFAMDAVVDDRQTIVVNGQSVANPTYGMPICRVTRDGAPTLDTSGRPVSDPDALKSLAAGCKPLNIFGNTYSTTASFPGYAVNGQPVTYNAAQLQREALDYAFVENASSGKNSLHDLSLTVSGTLWQGLGAGPLTGAFGLEFRQDEVNNPGSLGAYYERFDIANGWSDKFGGRTRTSEGYVELNLPIISGQDGLDLWSINGALRYSSINNKGLAGTTRQSLTQTTPNWKFQTEFAPFDWVRFRLTRSQDLRAAGYRDLFINQPTPGGPDFLSGANPWRERTVESSENQQERWGTLTVGNPALKPEKSSTLTLGLVLSPSGWAQGMTFSVDYYNIRVKDGIYVSFANSDPINTCWRESGNRAAVANDPSITPINGLYDPNVEACRNVEFAQIVPTAEYDAYDVGNLNLQDIVSYNQSKPTNNLPYQRRGLDLAWSYNFPLNRAFDSLPGSVGLTLRAQRALESSGTSNTTEFFNVANCRAGQTILPCDVTLRYDLTGQIRSTNFIPGVSPSPYWSGNFIASYLIGDLTTSLSVRYVGGAKLDKTWCDTPGEDCYQDSEGRFLAGSVDDNSVSPYANFSLNASYNLKIANMRQFQVFGSVNNLFDKSPPWTAGYVSGASPSYNDVLGRAYRMGVRMRF